MAKASARYVCQDCGHVHTRWSGRCDGCGGWNTIVEDAPLSAPPLGGRGAARSRRAGQALEFVALHGESRPPQRLKTGISELDRVCGGGLTPGSAVLVGGDPGIGKSTVLLQASAALARAGVRCAYVSGEESIDQMRLRAARLGLADAPVALANSTDVGDVLASLESAEAPQAMVIDSIQTMYLSGLESAPGSVAQVRACAQEMIRVCKARGTVLMLVGHVTKEGLIAGPRVLEHMVDTVLYFEGERGHQFRILRAVKNRFGATDEIGVFEMTDRGLMAAPNPSALFLTERDEQVAGAVVFAGMEGTRPVLMEIQALVAPSALGTPRRAAVGWDAARLAMVLAVLDARCGVSFAGRDVYLSVAGGLRVNEPAADLAVAAALLSSMSDRPVAADTVVFGEVGLSGEVRAVGQTQARIKEAAKLGFKRAWTPRRRRDGEAERAPLELATVGRMDELVARLRPNVGAGRGADMLGIGGDAAPHANTANTRRAQ